MRLLITCGLLLLSLTAHGAMAVSGAAQEPIESDALAHSETDTQAYLAKVDRLLAMAASGTYGDLRRGASKELQSARDAMARILGTRATLDDLPHEDLLALQNAEDSIGAILRNNEKDRMVCRRVTKTGTRFATSECMTVAEREARAISAGQATGTVQRENCIPTADNPCGG